MSSQVDASVPADNIAVDKALIRQNFARTKAEITALQGRVNVARQSVFDPRPDLDAQLTTTRNNANTALSTSNTALTTAQRATSLAWLVANGIKVL